MFDNLARLQLNQPIRQMEIAIVMGNGDHRFPLGFQHRQQFEIENGLKLGILVSGPFIKQIDRTVLQPALQQSQSFALPLRECDGREASVVKADFMAKFEQV